MFRAASQSNARAYTPSLSSSSKSCMPSRPMSSSKPVKKVSSSHVIGGGERVGGSEQGGFGFDRSSKLFAQFKREVKLTQTDLFLTNIAPKLVACVPELLRSLCCFLKHSSQALVMHS